MEVSLSQLEDALGAQAAAIEEVCILIEEAGAADEFLQEIAYLIWVELGNAR